MSNSTGPSHAGGFARDAAQDGVLRKSADTGPNSAQADSAATHCEDRISASAKYEFSDR